MRLPLLTLVGLSLAGCSHNEALVFGTSTTIGASVSARPTEAGAPQIVIGFERQEGVWMPLRPVPQQPPGRPGGDPGWPDQPDPNARYASETYDAEGRLVRRDALSVFASIGARFSGEATSTQPSAAAGGGLAQFFATGAAAVNLTENEALVTVLRYDTSAVAYEQAQAVAAAASGAEAARLGVAEARERITRGDQVLACAFPQGDASRWPVIVDAVGARAGRDFRHFRALAQADARRILRNNILFLNEAATVVSTLPECSGDQE